MKWFGETFMSYKELKRRIRKEMYCKEIVLLLRKNCIIHAINKYKSSSGYYFTFVMLERRGNSAPHYFAQNQIVTFDAVQKISLAGWGSLPGALSGVASEAASIASTRQESERY